MTGTFRVYYLVKSAVNGPTRCWGIHHEESGFVVEATEVLFLMPTQTENMGPIPTIPRFVLKTIKAQLSFQDTEKTKAVLTPDLSAR